MSSTNLYINHANAYIMHAQARALANACSKSGHRISFFMRKGADCLSKWVGEAERQLRLLFEQARRHQVPAQASLRCDSGLVVEMGEFMYVWGEGMTSKALERRK